MSRNREDRDHHHSSSSERSKCTKAGCIRESQELDAYLKSNPALKSMREGFEGWIREHELTPYLNWLTPRQWAELKYGETLDDAGLVLIFEETELVDFFNNYIQCDWVVSGLSDVVRIAGYSGELGHMEYGVLQTRRGFAFGMGEESGEWSNSSSTQLSPSMSRWLEEERHY